MVWDHQPCHRFYGIALQKYDVSQNSLQGESKVIFKGSDLGLPRDHTSTNAMVDYLLTAEGGTEYTVSLAFTNNRGTL